MDSLNNKLKSYIRQRMYSFHTPGHKGRAEFFSGLSFPQCDLTELPGLDMLHNPRGVIAEAQKLAAKVYEADEAFFLVNGATSGNQTMLFSLTETLSNKKIRVERKSHRSVINALVLSGLTPDYIQPVIHPDFNLPLGLDAKSLMIDAREIGALHLTYPSYYGTTPDLQYIITIRDRLYPDLPVLVDQAHGAHYIDSLFPRGATKLGADVVTVSTHKTLAALTQAAMLLVQGDRINKTALRKSLELLQTSSPSYLLMASLESSLSFPGQIRIWQNLYAEVLMLHEKMEGKLKTLTQKDAGQYGIKEVDWTKILVNTSNLEVETAEAVTILRKQFGIEPELWDRENILFMLGIGNTPEDVRYLGKALDYLVTKHGRTNGKQRPRKDRIEPLPSPILHLTPREAWFKSKKKVKVKEALGKISGETISIYPPGIPLIALGEEVTPVIIDYLLNAAEYNWQGWEGFADGRISIIDL